MNKLSLFFFAAFLFVGCTNTNYPYPSGSGYGDPYRYDDPYRYRDRDHYEYKKSRDERRRLEEERERLEAERRRLEEERRKKQKYSNSHKKPKKETCPPGFYPSEQKCSNKERKAGCKDIRLPSGLGCVHR
ncbi:MAG: hypothetical protein KDD55_01455 [Bdellovibrionales bacterium]|nr:hypothetical protein [Bdellovibrionales bacterium]